MQHNERKFYMVFAPPSSDKKAREFQTTDAVGIRHGSPAI